jgi:hypothetical protein
MAAKNYVERIAHEYGWNHDRVERKLRISGIKGLLRNAERELSDAEREACKPPHEGNAYMMLGDYDRHIIDVLEGLRIHVHQLMHFDERAEKIGILEENRNMAYEKLFDSYSNMRYELEILRKLRLQKFLECLREDFRDVANYLFLETPLDGPQGTLLIKRGE